jgi:hypothetical protein
MTVIGVVKDPEARTLTITARFDAHAAVVPRKTVTRERSNP